MKDLPKLYTEFADWWPVLSPPEDYEEEAAFYRQAMVSAAKMNPRTLLELGSGGGNNAFHLKRHFATTLVDLSPAMLAISRELNPECEHIEGDMRTIRLDRRYDAVFIHDAIDFIRSAEDLRSTIVTAYEHCNFGGVALFAPDYALENFRPGTTHGGHDQGDRSLRYLEWDWDPDPGDNTYVSLMVYVMREGADSVRCVEDQQTYGLFSTDEWFEILEDAGFEPRSIPFEHSEPEGCASTVFLGLKTR